MNAKRVNSAAGVILAALEQNRVPAGIATALESAGMLMSPEQAQELEGLRARVAELEPLRAKYADAAATVAELVLKRGERRKVENALRDQVAELEDRERRIVALLPTERCIEYGTPNALDAAQAEYGAWELVAEVLGRSLPQPAPADRSAHRLTALLAPTQALTTAEPAGVPCSKCGDPVIWAKSTNSDGGFWQHTVVPGRVLEHFAEVAGAEGPHPFEKKYQGESDAKRRLARCKHCGEARTAPMHTEPGGAS